MVGPGGIREICARWVITGEMVLDSATHLGSGEEGAMVDMVLTRDRAEGKPLLTGSSLAGALRSYLVDRLYGYTREEPSRKWVANLFGGTRGDDEGSQSSLIIFDSISEQSDQSPEIRDGVAIDSRTGLAEDHKKFDLEVLPRRTRFPLRFELVVASSSAERDLVGLLAAALRGLEDGEIPIGARRSRGLGACHAEKWRVKRFDLTTQLGWLDWLDSDHRQPFSAMSRGPNAAGTATPIQGAPSTSTEVYSSVIKAIAFASDLPWSTNISIPKDRRNRVIITTTMKLDGGVLVRSPGTRADDPDVTHLQSGGKPILSGTGLFGCVLKPFADGERLIEWVTGHRESAVAEAADACWLLAHCDDGVVWGKYENNGWHLSSTPFPYISPALERQNVQQLRVFGQNCEILIWRAEQGFRGRVLRDSKDSNANKDLQPKREYQILVGNRLLDGPCAGFSLVGDAAGARHAVPLHCQERYFDPPSSWPLRLSVTHYLTQDEDSGTVRIGASRLVDVYIKEK